MENKDHNSVKGLRAGGGVGGVLDPCLGIAHIDVDDLPFIGQLKKKLEKVNNCCTGTRSPRTF